MQVYIHVWCIYIYWCIIRPVYTKYMHKKHVSAKVFHLSIRLFHIIPTNCVVSETSQIRPCGLENPPFKWNFLIGYAFKMKKKHLNVQQNQQPMVNPRQVPSWVFIIKTTSKFNRTNHQVQQTQVFSNEHLIIEPTTRVILTGKNNQGCLILRILEHQGTATTLGMAAWIVASKGSIHTVLTAVGVVMEWWYLW